MQTMHPVIVSGRHVLDTAIFPGDEFEERMRASRELMDARGLDGLVVYGNGERSEALTYLTNLAPRMRWALAFIPRRGEVRLVVAGPERDLHFSRASTWVNSLSAYDKLHEVATTWARALRDEAGNERLQWGLAGARHIRQGVLNDLARCLGQEANGWMDLDDDFDMLMHSPRPREVRLMRNNVERLRGIVDRSRHVLSAGGKAADAMRTAEREGLLDGAHEVRTLFSRDRGLTLQPFERLEPEIGPEFAGYIARRELGYWVEAMVSHNVSPAHAKAVTDVLSQMVAAAKAGTPISHLEQLCRSGIGEAKQHPFTARPVAQLGLAIHEKRPEQRLHAGGIYSLRAGLVFPDHTGAIGSVAVLVKDESAEILLESHPATTSLHELR